MPSDDWRQAQDEYNARRAEHYDLIDRGRWTGWERSLLNDDEVRNRRLLDDEERRCDGWFDRDMEYHDDEPEQSER